MIDADDLTDKQQLALTALLQYPTIKDAAKACGVSEPSVYRWLKQDVFATAYREARQQALSQATARLQAAASAAVDTLEEVSADTEASSSSRVAAATKILEFAYKANDLEDIAAMLDELREQSNERS